MKGVLEETLQPLQFFLPKLHGIWGKGWQFVPAPPSCQQPRRVSEGSSHCHQCHSCSARRGRVSSGSEEKKGTLQTDKPIFVQKLVCHSHMSFLWRKLSRVVLTALSVPGKKMEQQRLTVTCRQGRHDASSPRPETVIINLVCLDPSNRVPQDGKWVPQLRHLN